MIDYILEITDGLHDIVSQCAYDRVVSCLAIGIPLLCVASACFGFGMILYSFIRGRR